MKLGSTLSPYFPDHAPTWSDVVAVVGTLVALGYWIPRAFDPTVTSRPAVAIAVVGTIAVAAAAQRRTRSDRPNRRFADVPFVVRLGVVLFGLAVVVVAAPRLPGSDSVHFGVAMGMVIGGVAYWIAWLLWARDVSGWWRSRERSD